MSSDPCNYVHGLRVNAGVVCWQLTLCDPHLSALAVRFSRRCAIQIDVYLYLPLPFGVEMMHFGAFIPEI